MAEKNKVRKAKKKVKKKEDEKVETEEKEEKPEETETAEEDTEEEEEGAEESEITEEEEVEIEEEVEEEEKEVRIKPKIPDDVKSLLKRRRHLPGKKIKFRRQEWFRYKRLGDSWRRPKGLHSKMRKHKKYRPPVVKVGYRSPRIIRGLHPSGFREVLVYNPKDLNKINPETEAARIGGTVGLKKREIIERRAKRMGIKILNPTGLEGGE